ncbi:hypothetical protein M2650_12975 [Luteimonas sp. SX5]|uniref:DUF4175 domain-containing protein n=1 Tax=Luteimonas galliterrae TaxID=2940486 RepID=A0ABT0MKX4_9GAMM|nr:hypothetical protein [Luteimonas galliterrae]MCL1635535.1 hypothetical protein [Luteimonas galliterrae]
MRSILYLLIGFAAVLLAGFWFADSMMAPLQQTVSAAEPMALRSADMPMLWALTALAWFTAFYVRPWWLCLLHNLIVLFFAGLFIVGGAATAYFDHYMNPKDDIGRVTFWFGVLILASRVVTLFLLLRKPPAEALT